MTDILPVPTPRSQTGQGKRHLSLRVPCKRPWNARPATCCYTLDGRTHCRTTSNRAPKLVLPCPGSATDRPDVPSPDGPIRMSPTIADNARSPVAFRIRVVPDEDRIDRTSAPRTSRPGSSRRRSASRWSRPRQSSSAGQAARLRSTSRASRARVWSRPTTATPSRRRRPSPTSPHDPARRPSSHRSPRKAEAFPAHGRLTLAPPSSRGRSARWPPVARNTAPPATTPASSTSASGSTAGWSSRTS